MKPNTFYKGRKGPFAFLFEWYPHYVRYPKKNVGFAFRLNVLGGAGYWMSCRRFVKSGFTFYVGRNSKKMWWDANHRNWGDNSRFVRWTHIQVGFTRNANKVPY